MEAAFQKKESKRPSFLQRLMKTQPKENALVEINNLLAESQLQSITHEQIVAIGQKYKVNPIKRYSSQLNDLYRTFLEFCLTDKSLSTSELDGLRHLKNLFNLSDKKITQITNEVTSHVYRNEIERAIQDGRLNEEERTFLKKIQTDIKLPEEIANKLYQESAEKHLQSFLTNAVSDERISPEEEQEFHAIAKSLDLDVEMEEATRNLFEKYKLYWQLENGDLPILDCPLNLQKSETCHFVADIDWLEQRRVTRRVNYSGPTMRIKIAKGLYWRTGSVAVRTVSEEVLKNIDSGALYVTNKRLIFMGHSGNKTIRLKSILDFTVYRNGIEIEKDSGKSPFFQFSKNVDIFAMILGRIIKDSD